jgi:RNA polymerase sigma-70 factor (ECF subfamily)
MARTLDEMREAGPEVAPESDFIRRARDGDRAAFDALVRTHFQRVYAFTHRLIGSHEDAEDLAQECFVRAWRALPHYREEAAFATWLCRIALHLAQDHRRSGARRAIAIPIDVAPPGTRHEGSEERGRLRGEDLRPSSEPSPADALTRAELSREVLLALDRLPPRLRAALVLRAIEGREYDEVAEITGVRATTARTHVMQARRLLQRALGPWLSREGKPEEPR